MNVDTTEVDSLIDCYIFGPNRLVEECNRLRHKMQEQVKFLGPKPFQNPDDESIAGSVIDALALTIPVVQWDKAEVSHPFLTKTTQRAARVDGVSVHVEITEEKECVWITIPFEGSKDVFLFDPASNSYNQRKPPSFRWKFAVDGSLQNHNLLVLEVQSTDHLSQDVIRGRYSLFRKTVEDKINEAAPTIEHQRLLAESEILSCVKSRRRRYDNMRTLRDDIKDGTFSLTP